MDPANLTVNFSMIRDHLQLFLSLLFGLPIVSSVVIRFWIAGQAAKVQRTTNWFVPDDLESDVAKMHFARHHNRRAFARLIHRSSRHSTAVTNSPPGPNH